MGHYEIKLSDNDRFELYEDGAYLCSFTRSTFRDTLTALNRSSHWIGSILKLLNKKFPVTVTTTCKTSLERIVELLQEDGIADYLRSKGYRVVKLLDATDRDLITYLESFGYVVEGQLDGLPYSTTETFRGDRVAN